MNRREAVLALLALLALSAVPLGGGALQQGTLGVDLRTYMKFALL